MIWPFKRKPPPDEGPFFGEVQAGAPIRFDEEEGSAIEEAISSQREGTERFLDSLRSQGINVPGIEESAEQVEQETLESTAADALKWVAYRRYESHDYAAAAESCIKSLGFSGHAADRHHNTAEVWLLLARIHASADRFRTAASLLTEAKRAARSDDMVSSASGGILRNEALERAFDMSATWAEAVSRVELHIRERRTLPPSGSMSIPPSSSGRFDD